MPGPPKNRNSMTHGVYGYFVTGALPRGAGYIRKLGGEIRRGIELAVLKKKGELSLYDSAVIQTVVRHETRALLLQRWLREAEASGKPLALTDKVSLLREIGSASDARDRCLRHLGLNTGNVADLLEGLYSPHSQARDAVNDTDTANHTGDDYDAEDAAEEAEDDEDA